tara:strand:+ start:304 stop:732 length:429 start_codon:yes stop_codon:yes gene_type:complete
MLPTTTRCDVLRALQVEMNTVLTGYNTDNSTNIQCFYSNTVEKVPSDLSTFLRFTVNFEPETELLDAVTSRQAGIATVQVAVKLGKGLNESSAISDAVQKGFKRLHWPDDVMQIIKTGLFEVGADGSNYLTNVLIYFQYNTG